MNNRQYCCKFKEFCGTCPDDCKIAKRNKDIAEFEIAKKELFEMIENYFLKLYWILERFFGKIKKE